MAVVIMAMDKLQPFNSSNKHPNTHAPAPISTKLRRKLRRRRSPNNPPPPPTHTPRPLRLAPRRRTPPVGTALDQHGADPHAMVPVVMATTIL